MNINIKTWQQRSGDLGMYSKVDAMLAEIAELRKSLEEICGGGLTSQEYRFLAAKAFSREEERRITTRKANDIIPITGDRRKKHAKED